MSWVKTLRVVADMAPEMESLTRSSAETAEHMGPRPDRESQARAEAAEPGPSRHHDQPSPDGGRHSINYNILTSVAAS